MPSSPISKCTEAKEYTSENTRGRSGILDKKPHLFTLASSEGETVGDWERCPGVYDAGDLSDVRGRSKICNVDLSDVTARRDEEGEIDMVKMNAGSTPRRSSAMRAQLDVLKTRIKVPVSLADAKR